MGHKTTDEMVEETLQRVMRMETRMVQLGDHVGANLRTKQRIDIETTSTGLLAYVDSYDVSFSRIMAEAKGSPHFRHAQANGESPQLVRVPVRMGTRRSFVPIGEVFVAPT